MTEKSRKLIQRSLVERLSKIRNVENVFKDQKKVELNYRWEFKDNDLGGKTRAYIEMTCGDFNIRSSEFSPDYNPKKARNVIMQEASELGDYLKQIGVSGIKLLGYYQKGEKIQKKYWINLKI